MVSNYSPSCSLQWEGKARQHRDPVPSLGFTCEQTPGQPCVPSIEGKTELPQGLIVWPQVRSLRGVCIGRKAWPVKGKRWSLPQTGMGSRELACPLPPHCLWDHLRGLLGFQWPLVRSRLSQLLLNPFSLGTRTNQKFTWKPKIT